MKKILSSTIKIAVICCLFFILLLFIFMTCPKCQEVSESNCKIIKPVEYVEKECNCSCPDCFAEIQKAIDDYRHLEQRFKK